jgi:DNA-binding CsgD family transcriptional regulator
MSAEIRELSTKQSSAEPGPAQAGRPGEVTRWGRREVCAIPIRLLLDGDSPRLNGESTEHIRLLAASETPLPPILVHRETMRVIDGMHRLRAAALRGQQTIEAEFFEGNQADAFVGAVKANIEHGLPLTLADREAAAARIIRSHPHCSDRWIAAITGLAAGTVGSIRRRQDPSGSQVTARVGRDGRVRPLSSVNGRRIASDEIAKRPEASLREIARLAGISPATVRDVRERMRRGDDPISPRRPSGGEQIQVIRPAPGRGPADPARGTARNAALLLQNLRRDPSLRLTEAGRSLLRWLEPRAAGPGDWRGFIDAAPPHCAYLVAELARSCAAEWLDLAKQLEHRLGDRP